jgi:hypothetical protein
MKTPAITTLLLATLVTCDGGDGGTIREMMMNRSFISFSPGVNRVILGCLHFRQHLPAELFSCKKNRAVFLTK